MKLQLTFKNILAFCVFAMLMGEAHEIAHFIVGKILCGCWPVSRDFNAWEICECELGHFATIAGPIFSMSLAWIGMFLLKDQRASKQSFGFALIWANVPQARIMTALMGGGDERLFIRTITSDTVLYPYYKWIMIVMVLIMALPPIIASFRAVKNKHGWAYIVGFMILPLLIIGSYGFLFLNSLLKNGFLSDVWIMGTPLFITLHTVFLLMLLLLFLRKQLFTYSLDNGRLLVAQ